MVSKSVPFSKRNGKHNHEIQLCEAHGMVHIHDTKYNELIDGQELSTQTKCSIVLKLRTKKFKYLPAQNEIICNPNKSFYECLAVDFELIAKESTCCLPNLPYGSSAIDFDICQDFNNDNCTIAMHGILLNTKCKQSCEFIQFDGKFDGLNSIEDPYNIELIIKFSRPAFVEVQEEYLIHGFAVADMIGVVGGSLGVFVGFSFINVIQSFVNYLKVRMES